MTVLFKINYALPVVVIPVIHTIYGFTSFFTF